MLTLVVQNTHKSIGVLSNLPPLDPFAVVTGVNGSGKTHLLEAIVNSKVRLAINGQPVTQAEIRSFSWQTLDVGQTGPADASSRATNMSHHWQTLQALRQQQAESLRTHLMHLGADVSTAAVDVLFIRAGETVYLNDPSVTNLLATVNQQLQQHLQGNTTDAQGWATRIDPATLVPQHPGLAVLSRVQFQSKLVNSRITLDPFRQELSALFAAYRKAMEANVLNKDETTRTAAPLSDEEFMNEYGAPPWELLNEMLKDGGYRFRVSSPDDGGPFEVEIRSLNSVASWNFNDLSSGEKVLISFLLASYTVKNGRVNKQVPKVLLLDEVDAPLHPSMIASLLRTVSDVLVGEQGVHCIMTTHNPATVALAHSATIYRMSPDQPRLALSTREEAIQVLSAGLPTLAIAVEKRRVVWVESNNDVATLELMMNSLQKFVTGPFVPIFQSVGFKAVDDNADSEQSGGKERVKYIVKALNEAGMKNVRGLIDSDAASGPSEISNIFHLTDGERYAIENVLLDPLLIALLFIRERMSSGSLNRASFGLTDQGTFGGLEFTDSTALQRVIDTMFDHIGLPNGIADDGKKENIVLVNQSSVMIPTWFLKMRGHSWHAHLLSTFPCLKKWKTESERMNAVARTVVADVPGLLTKSALISIQALCNP
jgi:predicted ATPase